jgi:hypothetical protein
MGSTKRTYSSVDKRRAELERKRQQTDEHDELRLSGDPPRNSPLQSKLLLKPQLKKFGGPVSFPDEDSTSDTGPRNASGLSVFDKALRRNLKPLKRKQDNIHGSREDFVNTMHEQKKRKSSHEGTTHSYLPTPPVEVQKQQNEPAKQFKPAQVTKPAWIPNAKSRIPERISACEEPRQPYVAKQFEADKSLAPRRDLTGGRLSSKSKEAKLSVFSKHSRIHIERRLTKLRWSANQSDSPFLRLPAEVRNRIYEYALGSQTINIGYETYEEEQPVFKYHCTVFSRMTNPFKERQQHYVKISKGFTLLNNICRQLYLETAVLPYKLSTIAFDSNNIMVNFLLHEQRLSRSQRHGFKQIIVRNCLPGANMLTYLPNLEKVYLGGQQAHNKPSGWYNVVRREGEEPELQRKSIP